MLISPAVPHLAKFWLSSYRPKCCQPIKLQGSLKYNISRQNWLMKFIFGRQINISLDKVKSSVKISKDKSSTSWYYHFGCVQSGLLKVPIIRSLYFTTSPEKHGCKVDFLLTNKHESFLQVDSITLVLRSQACTKYPKQ